MNTISHSPGLLHRPLCSAAWESSVVGFSSIFVPLNVWVHSHQLGCMCLIWQRGIGKGWEALEIFGAAKEMVIGL